MPLQTYFVAQQIYLCQKEKIYHLATVANQEFPSASLGRTQKSETGRQISNYASCYDTMTSQYATQIWIEHLRFSLSTHGQELHIKFCR